MSKNIYYFIFGVACTLHIITKWFNEHAFTYLNDYYIDLLLNEYSSYHKSISFATTILFVICCIIWIYRQGLCAAKEQNEEIIYEETKEKDEIGYCKDK